MTALTEMMDLAMWTCEKYGVLMFAPHAADFCARRYAAANHKDASGISFVRCRKCARGEMQYKIARNKGANGRGCRKGRAHSKPGSFGRF